MTTTPQPLPLKRICVDASLVLHWILPDEWDEAVEALWLDWLQQGITIIGPPLLFIEVASTLRIRVSKKNMPISDAEAIFQSFNQLPIQGVNYLDLHIDAWELAKQYNRTRAYDMLYLALARREQIEFWTSDERLAIAVAGNEPLVHFVPFAPPTPYDRGAPQHAPSP
jgi:predicted nucleic acid-binding protein